MTNGPGASTMSLDIQEKREKETTMEFTSKITLAADPAGIVEELTRDESGPFDLGFLFISSFSKVTAQEIVMMLRKRIRVRHLIGCTCMGVIGTEKEIERRPASVLILGRFSGVKLLPFSLSQIQLENLRTKEEWYNFFEVYPNENPIFLTLPDPFLFDMNGFLEKINRFYPHCPVVGGLASAASGPGENTLILDEEQFEDGMVGVILTGSISVETIVSQGCRPIAQTFIVTKARDNVIYELAGRPFLQVLQEVLHQAPARDKLLAQEAVFVGIAMDEYRHEFKRGDFLIRGLMAIDQNTGAGAIADYVKAGQTIQFHVRDSAAATEDLYELLTLKQRQIQEKPRGALVFSCNGRGENLFAEKNHDIKMIQKYIGPVPAAGFFCAGEIGPVCQSNFLHGFTSSIALFYPGR